MLFQNVLQDFLSKDWLAYLNSWQGEKRTTNSSRVTRQTAKHFYPWTLFILGWSNAYSGNRKRGVGTGGSSRDCSINLTAAGWLKEPGFTVTCALFLYVLSHRSLFPGSLCSDTSTRDHLTAPRVMLLFVCSLNWVLQESLLDGLSTRFDAIYWYYLIFIFLLLLAVYLINSPIQNQKDGYHRSLSELYRTNHY